MSWITPKWTPVVKAMFDAPRPSMAEGKVLTRCYATGVSYDLRHISIYPCVEFGIVVHVDSDSGYNGHTFFEWVWKDKTKPMSKFAPVPAELMKRLYGDDIKTDIKEVAPWEVVWIGEWKAAHEVIEENGRILFKFLTNWCRRQWSSDFLTVGNINRVLHASMLRQNGKAMALAMFNPNLKGIGDAKAAAQALESYIRNKDVICAGTYDEEKKRTLADIKSAEESIERLNGEFQKVLDDAAEAMNALEANYGIVVEV